MNLTRKNRTYDKLLNINGGTSGSGSGSDSDRGSQSHKEQSQKKKFKNFSVKQV